LKYNYYDITENFQKYYKNNLSVNFLEKIFGQPNSDAGELKTSTKYSGEFHGATLPQTDQAKNTKARCPMKLNRGKEACFFTGDKRVNENAGLACMHTLFLREHNRVARSLKEVNPEWSSDIIFNEAKLIIAAMHQVITYNEYLPLLLGPLYMKRYELNVVENGYYYGYDATIDASVSNSFTTAAFRFGHSMINDELSMPNADWSSSQEAIPMKDSLFNPDAYLNDTHSNVNPILRGLLVDMSLTTETTFPTSMKDFLFAEKDSFGKDLFAINVQRGREHGLGTYNDYREFFGMQRARSFAELKEIPVDMRARFAEIYDNVDDIDVYVGGLAEEHVPGGLVGPTFAHMMAKQFHDLKVGDRFYFEHGACETTFTPAQLDELRKFTLSSLICTCTDTESVQKFPFFETSEFNQRVKCEDVTKLNFEAWKESFIHTKDHTGFQDSGSWTEWIPPMSNPPTLELDVLKRERPDDLCLNSIASELRFINDNPQGIKK
jgi:peroxidase